MSKEPSEIINNNIIERMSEHKRMLREGLIEEKHFVAVLNSTRHEAILEYLDNKVN